MTYGSYCYRKKNIQNVTLCRWAVTKTNAFWVSLLHYVSKVCNWSVSEKSEARREEAFWPTQRRVLHRDTPSVATSATETACCSYIASHAKQLKHIIGKNHYSNCHFRHPSQLFFFFVEFSRSFLQSRTGATQTKKLFSMTYEKFHKYLSDFCTSKQDKYKSWLYVCYPTGVWIVKEINK